MISVVLAENRSNYVDAIDSMHRDRKKVFVDFLKWSVPVVNGTHEIDQFDTSSAIYLIALEPGSGDHRGSVRLLPSEMPHILGNVFPQLCDAGVPTGRDIFEMTRFCVSPRLADRDSQLQVRSALGLGVIEFALLFGITRLTGTAHMAWLSQILAVGWDVEMLGTPQDIDGEQIGAIAINVSPATLGLMRARAGRRLPVLHLDLAQAA
jgi:N-acyl-L-homoserine lactone synthetase